MAALACGLAEQPRTAAALALTGGPLHWLMLPDEERAARRLESEREAAAFLETFWQRRTLRTGQLGGEPAHTFEERVAAADSLYAERDLRGSLSDRGHALILLGPPPLMRYGQRRMPAWEPARPGSRSSIRAPSVEVETWVYPVADLSPSLAALLATEAPGAGITLVFLTEGEHTHLSSGGHYLDLAARAAVRSAPHGGKGERRSAP